MTFRKLEERSRAFAAYLQNQLKLRKGDRVALMMPNLLQYPVALFGVLRAGMVVVNVNPLYTPRELEYQLKDSGASAIVIVSNFAHTLEKVVRNTQVKHVILTRMGDQLSTPKRTLVNFVVKYIKRLVPKYHLPDAISFRRVLQQGRRLQYVKPDIINADLAFCNIPAEQPASPKGRCSHTVICRPIWHSAKRHTARCWGKRTGGHGAAAVSHFALTVNCLLFIEFGGTNLLDYQSPISRRWSKSWRSIPLPLWSG